MVSSCDFVGGVTVVVVVVVAIVDDDDEFGDGDTCSTFGEFDVIV